MFRNIFNLLVGASVSEPHTSGYNAAFSLSEYIYMSYVISKIAIRISMFHLDLRSMRARATS